PEWYPHAMRRLLAVALIVVMSLAAVPLVSAEEPAPSITVVGSGSVSGVPDTAEVTAGVVTQAATASQAMSQNSATMEKVLKALAALGIADRDIHTTNVSIVPQRVSPPTGRPAPSPMPSAVVGYEVTNQVRVRVRNLSSLGRLLDTLVSQGANALGGIGFSIADPAPLLEQARSKAIADARQKAEGYATAGGGEVGRESFIRDTSVGPPRPMAGRMMAMAATP